MFDCQRAPTCSPQYTLSQENVKSPNQGRRVQHRTTDRKAAGRNARFGGIAYACFSTQLGQPRPRVRHQPTLIAKVPSRDQMMKVVGSGMGLLAMPNSPTAKSVPLMTSMDVSESESEAQKPYPAAPWDPCTDWLSWVPSYFPHTSMRFSLNFVAVASQWP